MLACQHLAIRGRCRAQGPIVKRNHAVAASEDNAGTIARKELNASSRQDYWRRRRRMRRIEEHDEEDGEEPLDVCFPLHPLLYLALALAFWLSEML